MGWKPHRESFRHSGIKGKVWTGDERLQEFRFLQYGEMPEYMPFEGPLGLELLRALVQNG